MSLQIWLPLNKNFDNQGLQKSIDLITSNTAPSINDAGKIGKCHYFNGTYVRGTYYGTGNITFSCWLKFNTLSNCHIIDARATAGEAGYQPLYYNTSNGIQIGSSASSFPYVPQTFSANTWYHIAIVYSLTETKVYIDGNFLTSSASSRGSDFNTNLNFTLGGRCSSSSSAINPFDGYLNDFRIYDHCLSEKEIKELAKGLICHYKLDNNGLGNKNILTNSTGFFGTTDWSGVISVEEENKSPYLIAQRTNTSSTSRTFCTHAAITSLVSSWSPGEKFTISGYYKIPSTEEFAVGANMFIRWTYTTSASTYKDTGFTVPITAIKDVWTKFEYTYEVPASYVDGSVNFYLSAFAQGLATIYWKQIKLEKGEKATYWVPAEDTNLFTNKLYDVSGYNYNGTFSNAPDIITDCPRFQGGLQMTGTTTASLPTIYTSNNLLSEYSISLWIKMDEDFTATKAIFNHVMNVYLIYYNSKLSIGVQWNHATSNSSSVNAWASGVKPTVGVWTHVVITFKDGVLTIYKDGIQANVSDRTSSGQFIAGDKGHALGSSSSLVGAVSDIREYATCLTAAAIKELYQTSASIDENGNVYGRELIEL